MKFGVRECANIVFRAKQPVRIGTSTFQAGQPVLYVDTATTSSLEQSTDTVYAEGGRGNTRLLAWEGNKTLTFSFTDALLSPIGFAILSGAGLFKRGNGNQGSETEDLVHFHMTSGANLNIDGTNGTIDLREAIAEFGTSAKICVEDAPIYIMGIENDGSLTGSLYSGEITVSGTGVLSIANVKLDGVAATKSAAVMVDYYIDLPGRHVYESDINPETFGGNYYVEADTLFRDQYTGKDLPANLTFPNVRLQSNFTMTFAGSGDPSTFDFTMDAFPGYTYFDRTKKVLAVMQVVDSIALGAEGAAAKADNPVMYHDEVPQDEEAFINDSDITDEELGDGVGYFVSKLGEGTTAGEPSLIALYNIGDAVTLKNYLVAKTAQNGTDIPMSSLRPVFEIVSGNSGGYITLDATDGYVVANANTPVSGTTRQHVIISATLPAGHAGTSTAPLVVYFGISVEDSNVAEG